MDRLRLGLILLAVSPAAWLVAVLANGYDGYTFALLLMLVGFALAAWAAPDSNRVVAALGFAVAAVGIGLFYKFTFFQGLPSDAGFVVLIGCAIAAVGCGIEARKGLAAGCAVIALGALLWVISDGTSGLEWQAGNLLALVGAAWSAFAALARA